MPKKADWTSYGETRALVDDIASAYLLRGRQGESSSPTPPTLTRWMTEVVDGVLERMRAHPDEEREQAPRSAYDVHRARPGESSWTTTALYEVALGALASREAITARWNMTELSVALHQVLTEQLRLAALSSESARFERLRASLREERRRVARELHDRVGHGVYLALQHLDLYERYAGRHPDQAAAKLVRAVEMLDEALVTTQQLATELRRPMPGEDLEYALRAYLDICAPSTVHTHVAFSGDTTRLTPGLNEELYLILREAIRNALRHSDPGRVTLDVEVTAREVRATVSDDGAGFDPAAMARTGGLTAMRERADALRGTLTVLSVAGGGTMVTLEVPLTPPRHGESPEKDEQ
ncbi:sensor histidine kinase [Sphaerisporangium aureirubrum]|uniref:Sensor histidine kinase n=1 Tax=Sphaerisporangium aureirubrum TaxID=1544736 RepID=A0ABW1NH06_9ACTN